MEKLLKKDVTFLWDDDYKKSLDTLKEKMFTTSILVFPDWKKQFHVHVDESCIVLGVVLTQPGAGYIDHPIAFASRKLSKAEGTAQPQSTKVWPCFMHYKNSGIIY